MRKMIQKLLFPALFLTLIVGQNAQSQAASTLTVQPAQGTRGSAFTASGQIARGSTGVRLLWDDGNSAIGLAESPVDAEGLFSVNLTVPIGASNGPARVIAFPLASSGADRGTAAFTVLADRPGPLTGRVVSQRGGVQVGLAGTTVKLLSARGMPLTSTQTDANGAFVFTEIPQGGYNLVVGPDDHYASAQEVQIPSGGGSVGTVEMVPIENLPAPAYISFVGAIALPLDALSHFSSSTLVSDQSSAKNTGVLAHFASLPPEARAVRVRFWAEAAFPANVPQSERAILFEVIDPAGGSLWKVKKTVRTPVDAQVPGLDFLTYTSSVPGPFPLDMNVSSFPPGEVYLRVTPYIGTKAGSAKIYFIQMTDLKNRWFQPWVQRKIDPQTDNSIRYLDSGGLVYILNASLPKSVVLPFTMNIPVPVFNYTFENVLGLSVPDFQEVLEAEPWEVVRTGVIKPKLETEIKLFSTDFSPPSFPILPVTDNQGHLKEYQLKRVTALGPTEFFKVTLYQIGPGIGCVNLCVLGCKVCAGWKVYVDFALGGKLDLQSHIYPDLALETWIIPEVTGTLGGHARVKLVVCNLDADITGTVGVNFPFRYRSNPDVAGFESPCIHLSGNVHGDIGCLGIGFGGGGSIGPYNLVGCDSPVSAAVKATMTGTSMKVDPSPAVAAGGEGAGLSVWVQDESTTGATIQPFVYYRFFQGNLWLPGQRLTPAAALVNEPKAALLENGHAVAIWVQNKRPLSEINANQMAQLAYQEIYSSFWNGSAWSAPLALTTNEVAEGSPSLAVSANGDFAVAAWTRVQEPPQNNPDQVQSENRVSIFVGNSWTSPQAIHASTGKIDSQVAVKVDNTGGVWAVWMRDDDADLTTFTDRKLFLARQTRTGWTVPEEIPNTPSGAFSPAIALDAQNQPIVVFLVPPSLNGELTSGLGNRSALWFARRSDTAWVTRAVTDRGGNSIYAETPSIEVASDGKAIIVFRRFGEDLVHQTGDLAMLAADLTLPAVQFQGDYLTRDGQSNWKVAYALNPRSRQSLLVSVKQAPASQGFLPAASQVMGISGKRSLSQAALNGPTISSIALDYLPDLAMTEADISFSNSHPLPGDSITISALVHNQGLRAFAGQATVKFYDLPVLPDSLPFHSAVINGPLQPGETVLIRAHYQVREGGIKRITIVLDGDLVVTEADEENNSASALLGEVPPPTNLIIVPDPVNQAMKLEWEAPATGGILEFEILRAVTGSRTFELVGSTTGNSFVDQLAAPGIQYQYMISVKDQFGVTSSATASDFYSVPEPVAPPEPRLFVQNFAADVVLSWFDASGLFALQFTENLGSKPTIWNRQTEGIFNDDGHQQFITTATTQARFYRLSRP
jgi:hypothetical protein